jgi:HPt (histidine-containing phosphotransfer) domain-containing protein
MMSATDLDDIRALMGPDWVRERLGDLAAELRTRFASTDNDSIARDAHALIGVAGMLGFGELSDLCRAVEVACR